jgi:hypothetical protein
MRTNQLVPLAAPKVASSRITIPDLRLLDTLVNILARNIETRSASLSDSASALCTPASGFVPVNLTAPQLASMPLQYTLYTNPATSLKANLILVWTCLWAGPGTGTDGRSHPEKETEFPVVFARSANDTSQVTYTP